MSGEDTGVVFEELVLAIVAIIGVSKIEHRFKEVTREEKDSSLNCKLFLAIPPRAVYSKAVPTSCASREA